MKVNSKSIAIKAEDKKIFSLVSNCTHFGKFLPDQVQDWEASENHCKFSIQGMVTLSLKISEKKEFSKVVFTAENNYNILVSFTINIKNSGSTSEVNVECEAEVPFYLQGMVKKPLQTFVDMTAEKIKSETENATA